MQAIHLKKTYVVVVSFFPGCKCDSNRSVPVQMYLQGTLLFYNHNKQLLEQAGRLLSRNSSSTSAHEADVTGTWYDITITTTPKLASQMCHFARFFFCSASYFKLRLFCTHNMMSMPSDKHVRTDWQPTLSSTRSSATSVCWTHDCASKAGQHWIGSFSACLPLCNSLRDFSFENRR